MDENTLMSMRKMSKPIIVYNKGGTIFNEYSSIKNAVYAFNSSSRTVTRALNSEEIIKKNIE